MTKREKVINSLERCTCYVPDACRDCAYDDKPAPDCWQSLERDALELLKEDETQLQYRDEVIYEEEKETKRLRKLLKEQEPRVLTLEEVLSQAWDYCYIEAQVRPHSKMLEMLCGTHRLYCTTSTVLERQNRGDSEYGKTWRCWNTRPTDEQRKATPWNEPPKEVEG